jgi:hypothetical protein
VAVKDTKSRIAATVLHQLVRMSVPQTVFYGFGSGYPGNNVSRISPKKAVIVPDNSVAGPTAILLRLLSGRYSEERNYCHF